MPGRSVARVDDVVGVDDHGRAVPGDLAAQQVEARVAMAFAMGTVEARYDISYTDYKEAGVTVRVK